MLESLVISQPFINLLKEVYLWIYVCVYTFNLKNSVILNTTLRIKLFWIELQKLIVY